MGDDIGIALRTRRTVMDGEVRMYAAEFREVLHYRTGAPVRYEPTGPFYISASRNRVIVHHAELHRSGDFELFSAAMALAIGAMEELARGKPA